MTFLNKIVFLYYALALGHSHKRVATLGLNKSAVWKHKSKFRQE